MTPIENFFKDQLWIPLFLIANLAGLLLIPFGLPGLWLQFAAALAVTLLTAHLGWLWTLAVLCLAASAEFVDWTLSLWGIESMKGSSLASWGSFILGFIFFFFGSLIPIPIPILGSMIGAVIMSFIGTFSGAIIGEAIAQKSLSPSLRVAAGAVFGRAMGVAAKSWIAFMALCLAIAGVLWDVYRQA